MSIASALQLSKSGLVTLCYIREHVKSYLVLSECFSYQLCLLSSQYFAMTTLLQIHKRLLLNQQALTQLFQ